MGLPSRIMLRHYWKKEIFWIDCYVMRNSSVMTTSLTMVNLIERCEILFGLPRPLARATGYPSAVRSYSVPTQDLICFRIFSQLSSIDRTSSLLRVLSVNTAVLPSRLLILLTSLSTRTGCIVITGKKEDSNRKG